MHCNAFHGLFLKWGRGSTSENCLFPHVNTFMPCNHLYRATASLISWPKHQIENDEASLHRYKFKNSQTLHVHVLKFFFFFFNNISSISSPFLFASLFHGRKKKKILQGVSNIALVISLAPAASSSEVLNLGKLRQSESHSWRNQIEKELIQRKKCVQMKIAAACFHSNAMCYQVKWVKKKKKYNL